ncbi:MAG: serine/threonine-protein kinase [Planctomycetota bacterium]
MTRSAKEIAAEAMRLRGGDRASFVEASCAGDVELRTSVERLLAMQDSATVIGEATGSIGELHESATGRAETTWIGGFRVFERLGSGAMGIVYLAEQQRPRRKVALKVIRPDVISEALTRRFELEADALARLKHQGIAQVFQSGVARVDDVDCPYFAMELVTGSPLDQHARSLDTTRKARLLMEVCAAVSHAHQRGIVHRDLKPANILVDEDGTPKVLDFGVARVLDGDGADAATDVAGTLAYMSPEQLLADEDIDTRADVYALGVVLYEVFAGERPFAEVFSSLYDARSGLATRQARRLSDLASTLDRDLDAIAFRAIAADREERYDSAGALAADLHNWLTGRPVQAREQTTLYVASKFARRNRGLVALLAACVLLLVSGVAGVTWQAVEATRGRTQALQEATRAQAVSDFLVNMLTSADPERALGTDLTVRELLDTSASSLDADLAEQPIVEATVQQAIANTYFGLGELDKAEFHADAAVRLAAEQFGSSDARTLEARKTLALVLIERGEYEQSESLMQSIIAGYEAVDPLEAELSRSDLARIKHESGFPEEALAIWERVSSSIESKLPDDHKKRLVVLHNYASALAGMSRYNEAESLFEEVITLRSRVYGADHPQTLASRNMLAGTIQKQGREREAADMLREIYESRLAALGPDHFSTLNSMGSLAVPLIRLGELDEAEDLVRRTLAGFRDRLGSEHPKTLIVMGNLAYLLEDRGRVDEAAALYRETIEITKRTSGIRSPDTWSPINNLAMLLEKSGDHTAAIVLYEELLSMCEELLPADHVYTALFRNNYADSLTSAGRLDDARDALDESHSILEAAFGAEHARTTTSLARRARLEAATGN